MRPSANVALALLFLAIPVLAQLPEKPPAAAPPLKQVGGLGFVDVAEITVVTVDVSVADKKGAVTHLTRSDFEVYQDGRLQELTNYGFYSRTGPPEPTPTAVQPPVPAVATPLAAAVPVAPPKEREPRFIAIYVDNENILPLNRNRVLDRVNDFVEKHLKAPDKMMVVSYQKSVKVLQPFTSEPDEISDALRALRKYTGGRSEVASSRRDIEDFVSENSKDPSTVDRALARARSFAREQKNTLTFTVRSIQELVSMMAGLPGKRSIIYVSDGLPMTPGMEVFYEIQDKYNDTSAVTQSRDYDGTDLFRSLVASASASGVSFYTIDARGLESESGTEAENRQSRSTMSAAVARTNYQDSLVYMADQTGGMAIINTNDVGPGLERVAADLDTFYSLGYRLVPSGQDRVHRVEVKVKGHPEYRLNYRRTFIEKTLPTKIGDRVVTGLAFDLEDNPLGIDLKMGTPAPAAGTRWTLPVEVRVPMDRLALIPDGADLTGHIMVYYAARDDDGKQSDLQRQEFDVRVPAADYKDAKDRVFTVTASLLIESGKYRISVGVRDELTNQAGYAGGRAIVHPDAK